jgi:erythromycin esterase
MRSHLQHCSLSIVSLDFKIKFNQFGSLTLKILVGIVLLNFTNSFVIAQGIKEVLVTGNKTEKQLHSDERHSYALKMSKNSCIDLEIKEISVDVAIDILDPNKRKIKTIYTYFSNGFELVSFIAPSNGTFYFVIYPQIETEGIDDSGIAEQKKRNQGIYELSSSKLFSGKEGIRRTEARQNTIEWIKENALILKSIKPESGFDDLVPLKPILKNVQIVGLGEATHGTKEFFQMKHRMIEFLVKEMGFKVIAIEASYACCNLINDYIQFGKGDFQRVLGLMGLHVDTEEFSDLIQWMRDYNSGVTNDKKIKIVGFDFQVNYLGGYFNQIMSYLEKVDPTIATKSDSLLKIVEKIDMGWRADIKLDSCKSKFIEFLGLFSLHRGEYIQRSSKEEYNNLFQHLKIIGQSLLVTSLNTFETRNEAVKLRDSFMASNLIELIQNDDPGTKFIVWAHNGHLSKLDPQSDQNSKMFGNYLKEAYGTNYYAFGFSFSKGSFQAYEFSPEKRKQVISELSVPDAKENTLDWYLKQTGIERFIVPFTGSILPDYMNEFINQRFEARSIGAIAGRNYANYVTTTIYVKRCYDALIFIDNTSRAVPLVPK